jgi:hypothetical protein
MSLTKTQISLLLFFQDSERKVDPIRIMKGIFIFSMEAPETWFPKDERYSFIPYSYGPWSRHVDADLESLRLKGLLKTSQAPGKTWSYYSLSEAGKSVAKELENSLDPKAVSYLHQIREFVLRLSFRNLLDTVYARYPDYAVNSVFKR